ncbi:MAG: transposase [Lewinellaceae bacterium]|nr:transposase [Lewinellaceae bacterium]
MDKYHTRSGGCVFVDAAHPARLSPNEDVWSEKPISVRTSSHNQRVVHPGSYARNAHELYSISTTDYIKATTVVELIGFLREELPGRSIYLVLDNARYQRCKLAFGSLWEIPGSPYIPAPYSPNLNLIEYSVLEISQKSQVLAGFHYPTKESFVEAIDNFIDEVNEGLHENEIDELMNLKFQLLEAA